MTVDLKHLNYAEYLALPEMKARYSIIDGECDLGGRTHSRSSAGCAKSVHEMS